ncbi:MAG: hypothetical protein P8009_08770 [Gammaproteobacteria bacterium]
MNEVLSAVRSAGEEAFFTTSRLPHEPAVERVVGDLRSALQSTLGARSIKQMALDESGEGAASDSPSDLGAAVPGEPPPR